MAASAVIIDEGDEVAQLKRIAENACNLLKQCGQLKNASAETRDWFGALRAKQRGGDCMMGNLMKPKFADGINSERQIGNKTKHKGK